MPQQQTTTNNKIVQILTTRSFIVQSVKETILSIKIINFFSQ